MNLKERGITVGDLLITSIIILTTTILVKTFNNDEKATHYLNKKETISYKKKILSEKFLSKISL
tara:strand:- start:31 stop:222 length:192 start_codon:yes stop_codon:yes gene_type:complete